jgi:hypothetical protein
MINIESPPIVSGDFEIGYKTSLPISKKVKNSAIMFYDFSPEIKVLKICTLLPQPKIKQFHFVFSQNGLLLFCATMNSVVCLFIILELSITGGKNFFRHIGRNFHLIFLYRAFKKFTSMRPYRGSHFLQNPISIKRAREILTLFVIFSYRYFPTKKTF